MKMVVFGAGFQGVACAWDMLQSPGIDSVLLIDSNKTALEAAAQKLDSHRLHIQQADINNFDTAVSLMKIGHVTVSAVPYFFNEHLTRAAIEARSHFVDMGGNTDLVFKQMTYHEQALAADVTIVPDMGLAPGFANLLAAELIESLDTVDRLEIRVGGLPQNPQPPLDYQLFFSVEGLINEYLGDCTVIQDGKRTVVKSLTDLEQLTFPEPVGPCEAFNTLGGTSTLPWTYEGRVKELNYKTVRYPGHCEKLVLLEDLGFFSTEPVKTRDGQEVSPRLTSSAILEKALRKPEPRDYVVIRVRAIGSRDGEQVEEIFECLDRYDEHTGFTAMMRTTAFPVSIVAQLLAEDIITEHGVFPPERIVPVGKVRQAMINRGIHIEHTVNVLTPKITSA